MATRRNAFLVFIFLIVLSIPAPAQEQPRRDPQAVAVLTQMTIATGWGRAGTVNDLTATGNVARYFEDRQDSVQITFKVRGAQRYRTEVNDGGTLTTTIVNGLRAATISSKATKFLPAQTAISMKPVAFPFLLDLTAAGDASVSVRYSGTEEVQGQVVHRVEIYREPDSNDPTAFIRKNAAAVTVWVSATTWLPVQIQYFRIAETNPSATLARLRRFSDYRMVGGLAVPFLQEEFVEKRLLYTLRLDQVRLNVGLSDSEFTLPSR